MTRASRMPDVISRADAQNQGLVRYFTGSPCKHGHVDERFVSNKRCATCSRLAQAARMEADPELRKKHAADAATWRAANPGRQNAYLVEWRKQNPDKFRQGCDDWARRNPDKIAEYARRSGKKWRSNNKEATRLHSRSRSARVSRQTPKWIDRAAVRDFYAACPDGWQVDHIIPINGETVSGLHVQGNLQYLTPPENQSKGNRWDPDWVNTYQLHDDILSPLVSDTDSRY